MPPAAPPLTLTAVSPASGQADLDVTVTLAGQFGLGVFTDFERPSQTAVSSFEVSIGAVALTAVERRSATELRGTLPAGALAVGTYDVEVRTSDGRTALLAGGYQAVTRAAALRFEPITGQRAEEPFMITLSAVDDAGALVVEAAGPVTLADLTGTVQPTAVTLSAGAWTGAVTISSAIDPDTLTAAGLFLSGVSNAFTVAPAAASRVSFTSAAQRIAAGACSGPLQLRLESASGQPAVSAAAVTVSVAAAGLAFFSDAGCATAAATVTIPAGTSDAAPLYFQGTTAGAFQVDATAAGLTGASQSETIDPGPAAALQLSSIASPQPQQKPFAITVTAVDAFGNVANSFSGSVTLSLGPSGTLSCASGCGAGLTSTTFSGGAWAGTLSVREAGIGKTLTATGGGLTVTSALFDVRLRSGPQVPWLSWAKTVAAPGETLTFDASGATDRESAANTLEVSWDFTATAIDGAEPPGAAPWTAFTTTKTVTATYPTAGTYYVRLAVRDPDGDIGYGDRHLVVVTAPANVCTVNTLSASDDGATDCASSFGTDGKLSIAEAVRLSNALPGRQAITFAFDASVTKPTIACSTCPSTLEVTDAVDLMGVFHGGRDVELAGWDLNIATTDVLVTGITMLRNTAIPGPRVLVRPGASLRAVRMTIRDEEGLTVLGPGAGAGTAGLALLEDVKFRRCYGSTINVESGGRLVMVGGEILRETNDFTNFRGITVNTCGAATGFAIDLRGVSLRNNQPGIYYESTCTQPISVVGCTFNRQDMGIQLLGTGGNGHVVADNLFTNNSNTAVVCGTATTFAERQRNVLFGNAADGCVAGDPGNLTVDPQYVDAVVDPADLSVQLTSPAVDAAADRGDDRNGVAPGRYFGGAPDRGAKESW